VRRLTFFILGWIVAASSAVSARADDMTLRWDDCGASGTALATFACDTDAGTSRLVVSFSLSAPRSLTGVEAMMEVLYPSSGGVPSWWDVPACRSSVFGVNAAATFTGCLSPWAPSAAGGAIFEPNFFGPAIGRLRAAVGVPPADSASLTAGTEYGVLSITLSHVKTTGAGSCSGCAQPAGIYLRTVECYNAVDPQSLVIFPATGADHRYFVGWQCEGSPTFDHEFVDGWTFMDCNVATKRTTWGAVKGLYR
jgi:hypothetical protein